jgi:hypothetical protein
MAAVDDIVVEVIVWDGAPINTKNPFGHVTTKITKNGVPYSYSLEDDPNPRVVCNTEAFNLLEKHEQSLRDGFGFILNVTQDQAKKIFLLMQTQFTSYSTYNCIYKKFAHNCTYAIQKSLNYADIHLYVEKTVLPSHLEEGLLKTKNNEKWLVKDIIQYKKGGSKGYLVVDESKNVLFHATAINSKDGWYMKDFYHTTLDSTGII